MRSRHDRPSSTREELQRLNSPRAALGDHPRSRGPHLYQVKVEHVDEANEVSATLMGDVVEPRREFIQTNALKVVNLDV
jgi:hypothetical protein